jgi:hypothetical protein
MTGRKEEVIVVDGEGGKRDRLKVTWSEEERKAKRSR